MKIGEFEVDVERKNIKNIHLAVYPPDGRVHISVPNYLSDWDISTFLYSKLSWIRKQYESVVSQLRQNRRDYVTGESHYLFGNRYILNIITSDDHMGITLSNSDINMSVRQNTSPQDKARILYTYYKNELRTELDKLIEKWRGLMNEQAPIKWDIDMVLRKWGQCYSKERKLVFSLLLARVPKKCIEYVVVHELTHLKVHEHNADFRNILFQYLPDWEARKKELDEFIALALPD